MTATPLKASISAATNPGTKLTASIAPKALRAIAQSDPLLRGVILIVIDDVALDQFDFFGPGYANVSGAMNPVSPPLTYCRTPWISSMVSSGAVGVYDWCWVSTVCGITRGGLLTGLHAQHSGFGWNQSGLQNFALAAVDVYAGHDLSQTTIPSALKASFNDGVLCGHFGKSHLTWSVPWGQTHSNDDHSVNQLGFDIFKGEMNNAGDDAGTHHFKFRKVVHTKGSNPVTSGPTDPSETLSRANWNASQVTDDAVAWIRSLPTDQKFFAYVCYNPPHAVFQLPPKQLLSATSIAEIEGGIPWEDGGSYTYGSILTNGGTANHYAVARRFGRYAVEAIDAEIRILLNEQVAISNLHGGTVNVQGIPSTTMANTAVFIVCDNGTVQEYAHTSDLGGPYVAAPPHFKRSMYNQALQVPLLVKSPWNPENTVRRKQFVMGVDLLPTIMEMFELGTDRTRPKHPADGVSFLDTIRDPLAAGKRDFLYSEALQGSILQAQLGDPTQDPTKFGWPGIDPTNPLGNGPQNLSQVLGFPGLHFPASTSGLSGYPIAGRALVRDYGGRRYSLVKPSISSEEFYEVTNSGQQLVSDFSKDSNGVSTGRLLHIQHPSDNLLTNGLITLGQQSILNDLRSRMNNLWTPGPLG